jgi:hypothetical protein
MEYHVDDPHDWTIGCILIMLISPPHLKDTVASSPWKAVGAPNLRVTTGPTGMAMVLKPDQKT